MVLKAKGVAGLEGSFSCGDVGFGKTEVAVRGIFKCVMDGKQCVLLTTTTVLAQQHWRTIRDRFAPTPSRWVSAESVPHGHGTP